MKDKLIETMELSLKYISSMSDKDIENITSGKYIFTIKKNKDINKKRKSEYKINLNKSKLKPDLDFGFIIEKISNLKERYEVEEYILNLKLTKEKILLLGEKIGIKIKKSYKKEQMIALIIESSIGRELNSEGLRKAIYEEN